MAGILFLSFWVDKYNLFKKSSMPYNYRFEFSKNMVKIGEFSILVYAVGALIFSLKTNQVAHPLNILGVVFAALFSFSSVLSFFLPSWIE